MARLVYTAITSLDGCVEDADGGFDWAAPDEEVHAHVNDRERPVGTYLYGRRLYDTMAAWETMPTDGAPAVVADYAQIWRAAEKVVYSRHPRMPRTGKTRFEGKFDAAAVRQMKDRAASDLSVGGTELAAHALRAGLVDEVQRYVVPCAVGRGKRFLPDDLRLGLELLEVHGFASGIVFLHYAVRTVEFGRSDPALARRSPG